MKWYIEVFTIEDANVLSRRFGLKYETVNHKQPNPVKVTYKFTFYNEDKWKLADRVKSKTKLVGIVVKDENLRKFSSSASS